MAGKRKDLSLELHKICDNVYFQPPATVRMKFPCIVYSLSGEGPTRADNFKYLNAKRYSVTVVDENPDSLLPDKVGDLPYTRFDRVYTSDGFYHFVYALYF